MEGRGEKVRGTRDLNLNQRSSALNSFINSASIENIFKEQTFLQRGHTHTHGQ